MDRSRRSHGGCATCASRSPGRCTSSPRLRTSTQSSGSRTTAPRATSRSRGACLGTPVAARSSCAVVRRLQPGRSSNPAVELGGQDRSPDDVLEARERRRDVEGLERILGEADPARGVAILRPAMESVDYAGRMLFSGLLSLPFPDDPIDAAVARVRLRPRTARRRTHRRVGLGRMRPDRDQPAHRAVVGARDSGRTSPTRGWSKDEIAAGDRAPRGQGLRPRRRVHRRGARRTAARSKPRRTSARASSSTRSATTPTSSSVCSSRCRRRSSTPRGTRSIRRRR